MAQDDKEKQTGKLGTLAVGGALLASTMFGACKKDGVNPGDEVDPTDTTTVVNPVDSTAIKDSLAKAEMAKIQAAARERVTFGNRWAEYYGGPTATGRNDAGELMETEEDRQRYRNDIASLSGKFDEVAVEPYFVPPGVLPEAIARVNLTGVDQRNRSIQSLLDRLNQIGPDAYLRDAGGKRVVYQGLELINFNNSQAAAAVKDYAVNLAKEYKGVIIVGAGQAHRYENENRRTLNGNYSGNVRKTLKEICQAVQALPGQKKAIVGDLAVVAEGEGISGFSPESNLAYFVATECTKDIQYNVNYEAGRAAFFDEHGNPGKFGDPNINFYANQNGARVRFTVLGQKDMSDAKLAEIRTGLGNSTGLYVGGQYNANRFYAGLYPNGDPKVASASVFVSGGHDLMQRQDLDKNLALKGKNLREAAPVNQISAEALEKFPVVVPMDKAANNR